MGARGSFTFVALAFATGCGGISRSDDPTETQSVDGAADVPSGNSRDASFDIRADDAAPGIERDGPFPSDGADARPSGPDVREETVRDVAADISEGDSHSDVAKSDTVDDASRGSNDGSPTTDTLDVIDDNAFPPCNSSVDCPTDQPYCKPSTHRCVSVTSITIWPSTSEIPTGRGFDYNFSATFSDQTSTDTIFEAQWSTISGTGTATVDSTGMVTGRSRGTVTVSVTFFGATTTTSTTVGPPVLDFVIDDFASFAQPGARAPLRATGVYTDGTTKDVKQSLQWSADDPTVATIDPSTYEIVAVAPGRTSISWQWGTTVANALFEVVQAPVVSLTIEPVAPSYETGQLVPFGVTGKFGDGSERRLDEEVTWASNTQPVAIVSNDRYRRGSLQTLSPGTTTLFANFGTVSGSTLVTVTGPALKSIALVPTNPSLVEGATLAFSAVGTFEDGSTRDITKHAFWRSANPPAGNFEFPLPTNPGLFRANAAGTTNATAELGFIATTPVTVVR